MHHRLFVCATFLLGLFVCVAAAAHAATPESYAAFTTGASAKHGLFTIWQKDGETYLELAPQQLDKDYLETIVPGNGVAEGPVWWGDTDYQPSELVRFERRGDSIVLLWPNWYALDPNSPSNELANLSNFPDSVVGIGKIVAEDAKTGRVIFDLSSLLADVMDLRNVLDESLPKGEAYSLDRSLSYVDSTKAFPINDEITVAQTWSTKEKHVIDTAPDARRLRIKVVYNFVALPVDDYRPRLADDRVGIYDDIYFDFAHDASGSRRLRYLIRWNFDPSDPSRPSRARHPMVIYLSNTIPPQYRGAISDAVLEWNKALARAGILDAIQVRQQPNDPSWDPDDYRYSVIRWLNEVKPGFGADSQTLFDPRTGEEIRTGVIVSAVVGVNTYNRWRYLVDPIRYGRTTDPVPSSFIHDSIFATLLHEMGHNLGLQHNFIAGMAYSMKQLQSKHFTSRHGIATTAMHYAPLNLWPRGTPQGDYFQTTLGPYDYYAIHYGYAAIPRAASPQAELPTLRRWAAAWSNPLDRYASDEDVSWSDGHAADPRVAQGELSNEPFAWCSTQLQMYRDELNALDRFWPRQGESFEQERTVYQWVMRGYMNCMPILAHYIGGQYLSRAHDGDPGAAPPIVPVSRSDERRAFDLLDRYLFERSALHLPAMMLERLGYAEWAGYGYTGWEGYGNLPVWAYDPPKRHDVPLTEAINDEQMKMIDFWLQPLVLARIDENPELASKQTMTLADLFSWLHAAIYRRMDEYATPLVERNLQALYLQRLGVLTSAPKKGTPPDAIALARAQEQLIAHEASEALRRPHDETTKAHLAELLHIATGKPVRPF